jgi:hypothetical protein
VLRKENLRTLPGATIRRLPASGAAWGAAGGNRLAGNIAFPGSGYKDLARLDDCDPRTAGLQACDGDDAALKGEVRFQACTFILAWGRAGFPSFFPSHRSPLSQPFYGRVQRAALAIHCDTHSPPMATHALALPAKPLAPRGSDCLSAPVLR